jgi:hypothetical protein
MTIGNIQGECELNIALFNVGVHKSWSSVVWMTKFCVVVPDSYESSVWNLLDVTLSSLKF